MAALLFLENPYKFSCKAWHKLSFKWKDINVSVFKYAKIFSESFSYYFNNILLKFHLLLFTSKMKYFYLK